jgi:hypothetical protein
MTEGQIKEPPALPVYYMRMTQPNVDARLGKLREGQVVPMDQARATRYLSAGVAVQVSKGEYDEHVDRRQQKATAQQNAFRALNDGAAVWDVATYRDVLTAPEKGLRLAVERGIPLVNVHNDPAAKKEAARAAQGGERATRASRRAAPKPMISPQAEGAAQDAGVVAPSNELTSEQQA